MPLRPESTEEERQATVLALACLALNRPGWDYFLRAIARKLDPGVAMYEGFKQANEDRAMQFSDGGPRAPAP